MKRAKVFLSSTFRDLEDTRRSLHVALQKAGLESVGMEFFVAEPEMSLDVCLREVEISDLILFIVADKFGTEYKDTGKSYTQLEFEKAVETHRPYISFLKNDPQDKRVQAFQDQIKKEGKQVDFFDDVRGISNVLFPALLKYILDHGSVVNRTRTFVNFADFYAESLREESFFNYNQKFVGRSKELRQLDDFLQGDSNIVVVKAAGGLGKSKLIYEFAKNRLGKSDWDFRFVPWQVNYDNDSISEMPAK